MKYIVIESNGLETPIIFSETERHIDIIINSDFKLISAGFCRFGVNRSGNLQVSCWGESLGLNKKSRLEVDEQLILKHNEFMI